MRPEVIPVSRPPEKLSRFVPAIRLITQKHTSPSGAKQVRESLKLAPNLQLTQAISNEWAVISLICNNVPADELLVLMDSPTAYKPLNDGLLCGQQKLLSAGTAPIQGSSLRENTLLIPKSISTAINIITKNAAGITGFWAEAVGGTEMPGRTRIRYRSEIPKRD